MRQVQPETLPKNSNFSPQKTGIRRASLHGTINSFKKLKIARPSCFAPKKAVVTRFL
jgi:hypothetical protein